MTGFKFESDNGVRTDIDVSAILIDPREIGNTNAAYSPYDKTITSPPIYKEDVADGIVGLPVKYSDIDGAGATGIISELQLSFVFVGIRSYDPADYPSQSPLLTDNFLFYGFASETGAAEPVYERITEESEIPMSHAFCGLSKLYQYNINTKYDLGATYTFTVPNRIIITSDRVDTFFSCVLFRLRDVCEHEEGSPITTTPDNVEIDHNFGDGNLELISDLGFTIPNADGFTGFEEFKPTLKFTFLPQNENSVATITIKYNRPDVGAFRVMTVIKDQTTGGLLNGDSVFVNVFGEDAISFTPDTDTTMIER